MRVLASEIYFVPQGAEIDMEKVKEYLGKLPFTFQDEIKPEVYLLCGWEESEKYCRKERAGSGPDSGFPHACLVNVKPGQITVTLGASVGDEITQGQRFIEWLSRQQYDFKVTDDYGKDWTEEFKGTGAAAFFE